MDTKLEFFTVHHDTEEIHHVLERVKKDGEHHWWETLLGKSPTAMGVFNFMLHLVVIFLTNMSIAYNYIVHKGLVHDKTNNPTPTTPNIQANTQQITILHYLLTVDL